MDDMNLTAAATLALLIQYFTFSLFVGAARYKTGVKAPATTGDPFFEATFRIQHNTLEQLIHVIPALWICSYFLSQTFAVVCAGLFFVGRIHLSFSNHVAKTITRTSFEKTLFVLTLSQRFQNCK